MMRNDTHRGRQAAILAAAAALALLGTLLFAGSASARPAYTWAYSGKSFDASDAFPNEELNYYYLGLRDVAIDQGHNTVYAGLSPEQKCTLLTCEPQENRIYKFNMAGQSQPFSALEPDTYIPEGHDNNNFAVDNSGGEHQGRIYVLNTETGHEAIFAFEPSGEEVHGNFPVQLGGSNMCAIATDPQGDFWINRFNGDKGEADEPNGELEEFDPEGKRTGNVVYTEITTTGSENFPCDSEDPLTIDSQGNFYYINQVVMREEAGYREGGIITKYSPDGVMHRGPIELPAGTHRPEGGTGTNYVATAVDPSTDELFIGRRGYCIPEVKCLPGLLRIYTPETGLESEIEIPGPPTGMAVDQDTHNLYISFGNSIKIFERQPLGNASVAKTLKPDVTPTSAVLHGIVNGDGSNVTECYFEWGDGFMENKAPCAEGNSYAANGGDHSVHAEISGLTLTYAYYFRLTVKNANGIVSHGISTAFRASSPPTASEVTVTNIDTSGAHFKANVAVNGSFTHFRFEYGKEAGKYTNVVPVHPPENAEYKYKVAAPQPIDVTVKGLESETTYHWRFVAENDAGTTATPDQSFTTFNKDPIGDSCANAHVRQQTGTRLLFDCRAYELVSAANAGGYNVESDLNPGEEPLSTSPWVDGRAVYSLHYGSVPGVAGNPTDFGHDPYVAVRGEHGWTTEYVGLPASGMTDPKPYGSPLMAYDGGLTEFAFGGEHICNPCFPDGSTNIPLRRADGTIEKGMRGLKEPAGNPSEFVAKYLSADGTHFIFGSNSVFETGGKPEGSIYDRNLVTGTTQVVSTLPDETTMSGGEVGELDVSSDGSRIVVGKAMGEDANGNTLWHPYMHIGTSKKTVDLEPGAGATSGVLYAGMSSDGTRVYYATKDKLVEADTDGQVDIYEADVLGTGPVVPKLVSTQGNTPSNATSCTPTEEWNAVFPGPSCGALPFAGGAGVAGDGTLYFLSPEQLQGTEGVAGAPNLYVRRPGGATKYVATLDDSTIDNPGVLDARNQAATHSYGDFQATANGHYAIFSSPLSLTGYPTGGHYLLYRYDAESGKVDCASCPLTGVAASADSMPPTYGLGVSEDGRVFFTTVQQLVLRDTNNVKDAYEWKNGKQQLISDGVDPIDSTMFGISADGVDAYFFTNAVLAEEDENGNSVKIYDARENGGFPFLPAARPCAASDECHGPGTEAPPPPNINTVTGGGHDRGNAKPTHCKKGFVKRHGKCVKKKRHHRKHPRHKHRHHHRGAHNG